MSPNQLVVRDLGIVVVGIAAITIVALAASSRDFVEPRREAPIVASGPPSAPLGARIYQQSCSGCHTTDGSPRIGPSFLHDYATVIALDDGSAVAMNEAYIRESIARPRAKARPGYPATMPSFEGILSDRDVTALVTYIQSLR